MPTVRRTYLTLAAPADVVPPRDAPRHAMTVARETVDAGAYRALYRLVGERWRWRDRDAWSDAQLAAHLARAEVAVHVARVDGEVAGYYELERHADGAVEIVYFGLAPAFIGQHLGGALLVRALDDAWALGATRVWLHTCTLDAPQALPNYLARGFRVDREETYTVDAPDGG